MPADVEVKDATDEETGWNAVITETAHDVGGIQVTTEGDVPLADVKTAKDGRTILIPQPSDNPDDPLNWSWGKKHLTLLSLFLPALLTDFGMTWGMSCGSSWT
jgi:hypothetical protein